MTAPPRAETAPLPWRALRRHLRRHGADDRAAGTMVSFVVGAAIFLTGTSVLLAFAIQPAPVSGLEAGHATAKGRSVLDVLLGTPGYPEAWEANQSSADQVRRLGLLEPGTSIRIDPVKFDRLARGKLYDPNPDDDAVDYHEAKYALGLTDHDFHLRVFPNVPLATSENYGITDMADYQVAYVGDHTGSVPTAIASAEQHILDRLDVGFSNQTRLTAGGAGSVFPDDSATLRAALVPLIGTGAAQAVINEGAAPKIDFRRVDAAQLATALPLQAGLTTALALHDGSWFGYTKSREMRVTLGVANFTGVATAAVQWSEFVDTDNGTGLRDDGDYGYLEVSPDGGATWYPITNNAAERSQDSPSSPFLGVQAYRGRAATINALTCAPCANAPEVRVALHWVADGDSRKGLGWIVDDVQIVTTGFLKTFERPEFDMLVVGSNVDQNALTPTEVKEAIRDFVEVYGGRLVVLGGDPNTNWLQPIFHVGIREASSGVATPDVTHPLLTVPNELNYGSFQTNGREWDFSSSNDADLFHMVVGTATGHRLSVSGKGAFGAGGDDGAIILSTYLPHAMPFDQAAGFLANAITYGRYHHLYLDFGPAVPDDVPVASVARLATMDKTRDRLGEYLDLNFVLYVWPGSVTTPGSAAAVRTPFEPTGLAATGGAGEVDLTWTAPTYVGAAPILGYHLYRGTVPGVTAYHASVGMNATFVDRAVTNGVTYYYNVTAYNGYGQGYSSRAANATPATVPGAPGTPTVVGAAGAFTVSWSAPTSTGGSALTNYTLWMQRGSETAMEVDAGLNTTWIHADLATSQTWAFKVRASNSKGDGAWSGTRSNSTLNAPAAPTGLVAAGQYDAVSLSWVPMGSPDVLGYKLYRGTSPGAYSLLATAAGRGTGSYLDSTAAAGTVYHYVARSYTSDEESADSAPASATALGLPSAPTALATTGSGAVGVVQLTITQPSNLGGDDAVDEYQVYRKPTGGVYALVATVPASGAITYHNDTGLTGGSAYTYQVAAVTTAGAGAVSAETTTLASAAPGTPVLALTGTVGQVGLTWTVASGATSYRVERGPSALDLAELATVGAANTTFSDFTFVEGETYWYRVVALNGNGLGASDPVTATPFNLASPPTLVASTGTGGAGRVLLTITAPGDTGGGGVASYNVYQATSSGGPWGTPTSVAYAGTPQAHTVTGLAAGTTYYFKVAAVTAAGEGEASLVAFAVASVL